MRYLVYILIGCAAGFAVCEPLENLVMVNDGLDFDSPENISDDYIRLTLITPSYKTMSELTEKISQWLGPGLTRVESNELILIQAPRDSGARVQFIAALLMLDIEAVVLE